MTIRHDTQGLPSALVAEPVGDDLRISLPEGPSEIFHVIRVSSLTQRTAAEILDHVERDPQQRVLVSYRRSSAEARDALRAAGLSFTGEDGRAFVRAPGILVERDRPAASRPPKRWEAEATAGSAVRNPFAKRGSRIPRWLLLHPTESFSLSGLAAATDLNPAAASRVVRALEDAALVHSAKPSSNARRRSVQVKRPNDLLDSWLPVWQRRRIARSHWDIGARDVDEAMHLVRQAMEGRVGGWAIGGVAGAALVRRTVEPAGILVWTTPEEMSALEDALQPEPARGGRGAVHVAAAPDAWTLNLAVSIDGFPIADPVQLWLDCGSEGERALEAADAVAEAAGWL
jgi:hypothetical protein